MKKQFLVIFSISFSLYLISCRIETNPCSLSEDVLADIQTLDSLIKLPETKERDKEWLKHNYNEPSILNAKRETYRFVRSSSFDTTEIVRIEEINGHYKVTKKVFASHQDTVGVTSEFEIRENDWKVFVHTLAANNFWTYPTTDNREGLDGANLLIEGYKLIKDECTLKNYHRVGRWSPIDTTFISMCKLFFQTKKE